MIFSYPSPSSSIATVIAILFGGSKLFWFLSIFLSMDFARLWGGCMRGGFLTVWLCSEASPDSLRSRFLLLRWLLCQLIGVGEPEACGDVSEPSWLLRTLTGVCDSIVGVLELEWSSCPF